METSASAASTKDGVDAEKDDDENANAVKQLQSLEEDAENFDQASGPQSYDLGFKKVYRFAGFRFTVKREKTRKSEPAQLLTVKKETQVPEGAGDEKEVSSEKTVMPGDAHCAEGNTKDTLKNGQTEHESPKTAEANEICSESAALANDTASPLRRFFTQGRSAFRKKKSFRKPKEGELHSPTEATEESKRKFDSSVSWEAFLCVGCSKQRARRKSSSSDEETEYKLAQESQKVEEPGQTKETVSDAILTSSEETDQGQGNSSPEQARSPSEGEGVSTWESLKRLVTPRRKSKTRMEERTEDPVVGSSLEHSTSDGELGKDESWVPFRKLMPKRRKKKSDGKPGPNHLNQTREDMVETAEEDSDIPAVVPSSEYEAAEQEKTEGQQVKDAEALRERTSEEERAEELEESEIIVRGQEGLVHMVTVAVVEGERAVSSIEESSPSWISAALTECIEQAKEEDEKETGKTSESAVLVEEAVVAAKTEPETREDRSDDTTASELELTSKAVTALEDTAEASCAEGTMEVSLAEATTEMVSAVSQLLETPATTCAGLI